MSNAISDKALEKWARNDLAAEGLGDGSYRFRFYFEGSSCRNGGRSFPAWILAHLTRDPNGAWRIAEVGVEIPRDAPGWKATCIHDSNKNSSANDLAAKSPAQGALLNEFLASDHPTENAGCFCTSVHVNHKLLLALSTINWWLEHGGTGSREYSA